MFQSLQVLDSSFLTISNKSATARAEQSIPQDRWFSPDSNVLKQLPSAALPWLLNKRVDNK